MSKIPCVTANPRSNASALHNIKKALAVLKKKQSVPLYLVYAEHEILRGNQDIIFELLAALRNAYKIRFEALSVAAGSGLGRSASSKVKRGGTEGGLFGSTKATNALSSGVKGPNSKSPKRGLFGAEHETFGDPGARDNTSLSPEQRGKFLIKPGEAWD